MGDERVFLIHKEEKYGERNSFMHEHCLVLIDYRSSNEGCFDWIFVFFMSVSFLLQISEVAALYDMTCSSKYFSYGEKI